MNKKKLTIWCPMQAEARALPIFSGADVSKVVTGIGKKKSLQWVRNQDLSNIENLVIVGYGGALDEGLKLGQVFVANEIVAHEDAVLKTRTLPATDSLVKKLNLSSVQTGSVYTSLRPVFSGSHRAKLKGLGARVVDMESWWLTQNMSPEVLKHTTIIRVISDTKSSNIFKLRAHLRIANQSLNKLGEALANLSAHL